VIPVITSLARKEVKKGIRKINPEAPQKAGMALLTIYYLTLAVTLI
jgi:hypothetical protein